MHLKRGQSINQAEEHYFRQMANYWPYLMKFPSCPCPEKIGSDRSMGGHIVNRISLPTLGSVYILRKDIGMGGS